MRNDPGNPALIFMLTIALAACFFYGIYLAAATPNKIGGLILIIASLTIGIYLQ